MYAALMGGIFLRNNKKVLIWCKVSSIIVLHKERSDLMFWKKVFGEVMYEKVQKYAKDRNLTISALVRVAVESYIER